MEKKSLYDAMRTELKTRTILSDASEKSQGFNEGIDWAIKMVERYQNNNGEYQKEVEAFTVDEFKSKVLDKINNIKDERVLAEVISSLVSRNTIKFGEDDAREDQGE